MTVLGPYGRMAAPLVYRLATLPVSLPLALDQVCRHLRLEAEDLEAGETALLEAAVAAAAEHLDGRAGLLNRALVTQGWIATTDRPARDPEGPLAGFLLDFGPVQAVTRVEYRAGGVYRDLAPGSWRLVARTGGRALVALADSGAAWPAAEADLEAWRLTLRVGYGDGPTAVPAPIRAALLLMVADLYDNRDGKVPANLVANPTVERLLSPYRRVGV